MTVLDKFNADSYCYDAEIPPELQKKCKKATSVTLGKKFVTNTGMRRKVGVVGCVASGPGINLATMELTSDTKLQNIAKRLLSHEWMKLHPSDGHTCTRMHQTHFTVYFYLFICL